jgi:hypothetical protein
MPKLLSLVAFGVLQDQQLLSAVYGETISPGWEATISCRGQVCAAAPAGKMVGEDS